MLVYRSVLLFPLKSHPYFKTSRNTSSSSGRGYYHHIFRIMESFQITGMSKQKPNPSTNRNLKFDKKNHQQESPSRHPFPSLPSLAHQCHRIFWNAALRVHVFGLCHLFLWLEQNRDAISTQTANDVTNRTSEVDRFPHTQIPVVFLESFQT